LLIFNGNFSNRLHGRFIDILEPTDLLPREDLSLARHKALLNQSSNGFGAGDIIADFAGPSVERP
jgi:hypothetical protein